MNTAIWGDRVPPLVNPFCACQTDLERQNVDCDKFDLDQVSGISIRMMTYDDRPAICMWKFWQYGRSFV